MVEALKKGFKEIKILALQQNFYGVEPRVFS